MNKKIKKEYGITLVALVITIIILLILVGISISALTNTEMFQRAKDAKAKSEEKELEQNQILDSYESEIYQYLPEKNGEKLVDKVNDGTIKVGDYVKYIPDTVSNTDEKYTTLISNLGTYSGSSANTTSTLTQEKLNWRVLDVKDGQVRLISEVLTTSTIALSGYNGYNNAVKLLDDTCSTLYNNSKLASKAQNLKIEDIQDKMIEKDYSKIDPNYGQRFKPSNKYYPSILQKEKEQKVTVGKNTITGSELDLSEQSSLINQANKTKVDTLDVKYTYWRKSMTSEDFDSNKYYELFINNGENYNRYWMSSRCVTADSNFAVFLVSFVASGGVGAASLSNSGVGEAPNAYAFRPVITLNSNVQIDTVNSGNGSTANDGYAIK